MHSTTERPQRPITPQQQQSPKGRFESSKLSACSKSLDLITTSASLKETSNISSSFGGNKKCRPEFYRHLSDDPFLSSVLGSGGSLSNGSPSRLPRSTSRPLVMATSSQNSLCSSSTLLPNSPSISEMTDLEPDDADDEDVFGSVSDNNSDHDPFDPPLVSISSCESTDPCSASVYESPVSSFNESPTSSPSYATPMERSPWASPQASIKSRSPTRSIRRSPSPLVSPPSSQLLLRVRSPSSSSNGSVDVPTTTTIRRTQSVKTRLQTSVEDYSNGPTNG